MKRLNRILKGILLDAAYALPFVILFTLVVLQLAFDFNMIIYCTSVIFVGVLSKLWINFVEKSLINKIK